MNIFLSIQLDNIINTTMLEHDKKYGDKRCKKI